MTLNVLMIAFWQAVAVFVLCLFAKNRGYAVLIGLVGCVVVTITGGNRYDGLDVLFVIVATLAAVWKLTPYEEGETPGEVLAFAGKAAGVVLGVIGCGVAGLWYYNNRAVIEAASPAPVSANSNHGGYVASRSYSSESGSSAVAVVSEASRVEKLARANAEAEVLLKSTPYYWEHLAPGGQRAPTERALTGSGGDKRRCLDLKDNAAVARCAGG
ncbi:MAG: hypothetical protein RBS05_04070 [Zoogloea oleivorans]|jgi:hypothetical protein|uniref:hypothetical protein n=1 Tax=Zoogloea oleivorans TaxID=1552750 RepID=UPI002A361CA9|nr:hypothetical protein [Zoogloea oleivorans]MDY0035067.1 hypothetical protein [Zoogloea oleivorans]